MKGVTFSTVLLALVAVLLLVSTGLVTFTMYRLSSPADPADAQGIFWTKNKMFLMTPTIINMISMALLGVFFVMG